MKQALFLAAVFAVVACDKHHESSADHDKGSAGHASGPAPTPREEVNPAASAVMAYANATTCADREKVMVFPEHNRLGSACAPLPGAPIAATDPYTKSCDTLDAGSTHCTTNAHLLGKNQPFWLVQQPNGFFLVDHRATVADQREEQLATLDGILKHRPLVPTVVRLSARLSTEFDDAGFTAATYHHVKFLGGQAALSGYITKTNPDAAALVAYLSSADSHPKVVVAIKFTSTKAYTPAIITRFLSPGYYETEAEHELESKDGGS